jgi:hypothetical protein
VLAASTGEVLAASGETAGAMNPILFGLLRCDFFSVRFFFFD